MFVVGVVMVMMVVVVVVMTGVIVPAMVVSAMLISVVVKVVIAVIAWLFSRDKCCKLLRFDSSRDLQHWIGIVWVLV